MNININWIAIQWTKWLWKDTISNLLNDLLLKKFRTSLKRYAFWDVLKLLSIDKENDFYKKYKDKYNYNYIIEDINDFKNNINWIKDNLFNDKKLTIEEKNKINIILLKNINNINNDEKLFLIEYFKNIPTLKTRINVQTYSDIIKKDTWKISVFSEYLIELIKKENNFKTNNIINTDTRFIIEAIDLLLNDFLLIKLKNDYVSKSFLWKEHLQHVSETELWINENIIWIEFNITNENNIKDSLRRKNLNEIKNDIELNLIPIIKKFNWYSTNFKNSLNIIKDNLLKDSKYLELQIEYSNLYKEYHFLTYSWDKEKIEPKLKDSYNNYIKHVNIYILKINDLFNIELSNIKKKLNKKNINKLI